MTTSALFGATGLVGGNILTTLISSESVGLVHTISRRQPKDSGPKLTAVIEPESAAWATRLSALSPSPTMVFSAVGTTRADAGGIDKQWKIDHDLNIELAKAAKAAGTKVFVFISSGGTRGLLSSCFPYSRMKIGVEDSMKDLDFDHAIILRPGLLLGNRDKGNEKPGGSILNPLVDTIGSVFGQGAMDALGQDGLVVARAAVHAAILAEQGKTPAKYWVMEQADIVKYGRVEWKQ